MLVSPHQNFRVNQPAVIAEVIDNEAIVVNLDSGAYYSLRGSACTIWEMLAQQMAVPAVVHVAVLRPAAARLVRGVVEGSIGPGTAMAAVADVM